MSQDGRITIGTKIDQLGADHGIKELKKKLEKTAKQAEKIGKNMSTYVTVPITALSAAGFKAAMDISGSLKTIQNGLGITKDEAQELTDVANDIYKKGFGQSLDEVSRAVVNVKQNFKDLVDENNIDKVTQDALILAETLGEDINWVTRAGTTMMKEFGTSSEEAFDLIAWGSQNGLNFSQEMLDNIAEYGPLFSNMGYSAEEYFNMLKQGSEEGAYNLDYINDVMKEFQIRVKDGSDKTADAMELMSESTQQVWKDFLDGKGTVKDVNDAVLKELGSMDDKLKAGQIGVELYGTKWEDLESDAVLALGGVDSEINNLDGTMKNITKSQEESFGNRFKSMLRESKDALIPLGEILLNLAQQMLPPLINTITKLAEWFSNLNPITRNVILVVIGLVAALGPLLMIAAQIIPFLIGLKLATLGWSLAIIGIIAVVAIAAYFIIKYWDEIVTFIKEALKKSEEFIVNSWNWVVSKSKEIWGWIKDFFKKYWDELLAIFTGPIGILIYTIIHNWDKIRAKTKAIWGSIGSFFSGVWDDIISGVNKFKDAFLSVWNAIKTGIKAAINPIINMLNLVINGYELMLNGLSKTINKIPSFKIPDWVPGIGGGSFGLPHIPKINLPNIPSLDVGTNFVAKDGLAMLHAGEAVVPKEYNPALDNNSKQPAEITFVLGGNEYTTFVEDITEYQERSKYRLKRR